MAAIDNDRLVTACIQCIDKEIIPLTAEGVKRGSKVFGAAILLKEGLTTVIAETNNELECPLWHGEVHCIKKFYEMASDLRPRPKDCIFLTTHEPCSLCLSAITWAGFDVFYYLFTYEDSRDLFAIPHDINILKEVYQVPGPNDSAASLEMRPLYNKRNLFFSSYSLEELAAGVDDKQRSTGLVAGLSALKERYNALSATYQSTKGKADLAFA